MRTSRSQNLKSPISDGGYQVDFLGPSFRIKLPELNAAQKKDVTKSVSGSSRIDYIHYSAVMSKKRQLAYFTAVTPLLRTAVSKGISNANCCPFVYPFSLHSEVY
jgi:hypothetical protein